MTENCKKFAQYVSQNKEVEDKLNSLDMNSEDFCVNIINIASEAGFELETSDIKPTCDEIDEEELAAVSGGGKCYCFAGGGGSADPCEGHLCASNQYSYVEQGKSCFCIGSGSGEYDKYRKGDTWNPWVHWERCSCVIYGSGETKTFKA